MRAKSKSAVRHFYSQFLGDGGSSHGCATAELDHKRESVSGSKTQVLSLSLWKKKQQAACNTYTITRQEKEKLRPNTIKRKRESAAAACVPSPPRMRDADLSLWGGSSVSRDASPCFSVCLSVCIMYS